MASSVQQKQSSICVASASQPSPKAQNDDSKDEMIEKLNNDWKKNSTIERAFNRIKRLGINHNKLKKPSEYKPEDFFSKKRNLNFIKISTTVKPCNIFTRY
jgi:hypothetical protein